MNLCVSRKEENRRRIVDTAARLFLRKGVDRVGVDEIMRECGMTHGGFYGYFPSKDALITEACTAALLKAAGEWVELVRRLRDDAAWEHFAADYLASGLTSHNPACSVAFLAPEVARLHVTLDHVDVVRSLIDQVAAELGSEHNQAIVIIAALVGATALAAQVSQDERLTAEILNATREGLLRSLPVWPDADLGNRQRW